MSAVSVDLGVYSALDLTAENHAEVHLGSLRFDGVRFAIYSKDHWPPHVHGFYAGVEVIVEIHPDYVRRARRKDSIRPLNSKISDISHIENTAAKYRNQLIAMWRTIDVASRR